MKKLFYLLPVLLVFIWASCDDDSDMPSEGPKITLFQTENPIGVGAINEDDNTISVNYEFGEDISAVTVIITSDAPSASVTPASPVDFSNGPVVFTLDDNGNTSEYTVTMVEGENPLRIVLVGEAADVNGNGDEVANAYNWALDEYGNKAKYVSFGDLENEDISTAKALWFHLEAPGRELPSGATGSALDKINDFYKGGGNLLLSKHATQYLVNLGRITSDWGPTDGGDGVDPFDNGDDWGQSFEFSDKFIDGNADSPIFSNLETKEVSFDGFTYDAYMFIDGGTKRDNAFFWFSYNIPGVKAEYDTDMDGTISEEERDTNGDGIFENGVDDDTIFRKYFEEQTNSSVRGAFEWDPVFAGVEFFTNVEFNPDGDYQGRAIALGAGCFEWFQNDGRTNTWRANLEGIHENIFAYFGVE